MHGEGARGGGDVSRELTPEERDEVKRIKADPEWRAMVRRGIAAVKAGRVRPWSEVKKELGL